MKNYWMKTANEQEDIRRDSKTLAGHGGQVWHVSGIIVTGGNQYFCECEHCRGHDGEKEHLNIDEIVCAPKETAAGVAGDTVLPSEEWEWSDGPHLMPIRSFGNTEADIS